MKINTYKSVLTDDRHNRLELDKSFDYEIEKINDPEKVVAMMKDIFRIHEMAEEFVYLIAVDSDCHVNAVFEVSHGSVNESYAGVREIFIRLLLTGATGFMVVHNHPSGNPNPSKADDDGAYKLSEASKIMGIQMHDFIIIGRNKYFSFREEERLCVM